MAFILERVVPQKLAVVVMGFKVDFHAQKLDPDHALDAVQLRTHPEGIKSRSARPDLACKARVVNASPVTHARQRGARALQPERLDQLVPQGLHRRCVQQQHALTTKRNPPLLGREPQPVEQILDCGQCRDAPLRQALHVSPPVAPATGART